MKIYVITKGEYSDYHICAVTTNPDDAEVLKTRFSAGSWGDATIEEYDTDDNKDVLANKNLYLVSFYENGNVYNVRYSADIECYSDEVIFFNRDNIKSCMVKVFAFNEESAIKIASEKRAVALAHKKGIS